MQVRLQKICDRVYLIQLLLCTLLSNCCLIVNRKSLHKSYALIELIRRSHSQSTVRCDEVFSWTTSWKSEQYLNVGRSNFNLFAVIWSPGTMINRLLSSLFLSRWKTALGVTDYKQLLNFVDFCHFLHTLQQQYCFKWNCDRKHTSSEWCSAVCCNLAAYWVSHVISHVRWLYATNECTNHR